MAQVYSTVLDGKPLGPRVDLEGNVEWLEGGKPLPRSSVLKERIGILLGLLISPIIITHALPGVVSRPRGVHLV